MKEILVETSARHVHVSKEDLETLFGKGYQLTMKKPLSQPGQYVCHERVDLIGPKKTIAGVSILGPERSATQVEVSLTDARTLGVVAPIRESGDIKESAPLKIVGPNGEIEIKEGCIVAKRHIHMTKDEAKEFGVNNGDIVKVQIDSPSGRSLIFDDVVIRASDNYALAMHIDTDESNAGGLSGVVYGHIVK